MVNGNLVAIVLIAIAMLTLGVGVFVRNPSQPLNRKFIGFTTAVSVWLITNYLAATTQVTHAISLLSNRIVDVAGGLAIVLLLNFLLKLAGWKWGKLWWQGLVVLNVTAWVLCLTPYVVSDVKFKSNEVVLVFGSMAFVYFASLFVTFIATLIVLIFGHFRLKEPKKTQMDTISASIIFVIPLILICNALLPIAGYYGLVNWSALSITLIVFAMSYTIAKHRLFNIRAVIARTVGYVFSIGGIAGLYSIATLIIIRLLLHQRISLFAEILLAISTAVACLTFGPLKNKFDRFTVRIFYKDAYDPQVLYAELNKILVSSLDTRYLMMQSISVIETSLKPEYASIGLKNDDGSLRWFASRKLQLKPTEFTKLRRLSAASHNKVLIADDLEENDEALRELMRSNDIAVIVRLTQDLRRNEEGMGYMLFGSKKSGSPYTRGDMSTLDTIANELIIAIQNALHFEEIQNFNVTLQTRIEEATRQLRRTNAKLEALDETKDDFISMASHQLRTPLTSVKGYLSMVLEGDAGKLNETQRKMLGQAFFSSQRMVYLIADLLNVSRLKTGKFIIDWAPVDLSKVIEEEISQLVETAAARDIKLTYKKPADFPTVMLDETKTRQVIMNFIDNAIYYTPAGGHIAVHLEDHIVSIELRVVDDGIGVPRAEQHHLFTKFYRARNAQKARPDGTGLGLFMAKKVIVAQGGSVIFESKEGKGSTFGFNFPKVALERLSAAAPAPQNTPVRTKKAPQTAKKA